MIAAAVAASGCAGEGRTTLRLASWADEVEQRIENRNLARFEERHPRVRVVNDAISAQAEYREQVLTSIAAGAPPDVLLLDNIDVPAFASRDVLLDLGPLLGEAGVDTSQFDPRVRGIFERDGRILALPKGYTPMVVVYNRKLFREAGITPPKGNWTWEEFHRAARALTRDTNGDGKIDQWGALFDRRAFIWLPWIWSGGGEVLCPDGQTASGCLDSPATIQAVRWYTDWVLRDSISPRFQTLRQTLGDQFRLFNSGKLAMLTTGHFWVPQFRPAVLEGSLEIGFAPIPHRESVSPVTVVYASGWAVPAAGKNRRIAVQLAAELTDTAAQWTRVDQGLEISANRVVAERVAAEDTLGWERVFLEVMPTARMPWGSRVRGWREVEDRLPQAIDEILLEGSTVEEALHRAAVDIDKILWQTDR